MYELNYINFHTHFNDKDNDVLSLKNIHQKEKQLLAEGKFCSIGLHPWFLTKDNYQEDLAWLEENLKRKEVLVLGECGLDRLQGENLVFQQKAFEEQIALANQYQKPVIIHCVRAFSELIESVKRVRPEVAMIIHGFNKKESIFKMLEAEGFYFSFGASILNEHSPSYKIIQEIDERKFFLETDDKEISIKKIYEQASFLRKSELSNILANILDNIKNIGIHV